MGGTYSNISESERRVLIGAMVETTAWVYVGVCGRVWACVGVCECMRMYADECGCMRMYADECGCMRVYAGVRIGSMVETTASTMVLESRNWTSSSPCLTDTSPQWSTLR